MKRTTKVTLHRFASDDSLPQRDGVNLAHLEMNRLLASPLEGVQAGFHDFDRLLRDDGYARDVLGGADCVLCNVGPHAHYYHHLRERLGLDFRIVRDIRTALWSCYLLQESLCEPYLRDGDALLALSAYSSAVTRRLFPHLASHPIPIFEPVLAGERKPHARARKAPNGVVTLGHVGRLSHDKNFPQMVDLLVELDCHEPGRYRLVACGAVHSPECDPGLIADRIRRETGREGLFTYLPPQPHEEIVALLRTFDWFLFFSTSNLETLGRVLVEAAHAGVPVLAANHAAASELLHPSSLLEVAYSAAPFHSHFDAPMGHVDIAEAAARIRAGSLPHVPPPSRVNDVRVLVDVLQGCVESAIRAHSLKPAAQEFVERLHWADLPRYESREDAAALIEELRGWFCALNGKKDPGFAQRLKQLEAKSRFPERTRRFMGVVERTQCDFSNLGGFDMELCNIADFHPRFWLEEKREAFAPAEAARALA